jgi:DNA processing protein
MPSPPEVLAVVGDLVPGDALAVAVVGSRYPTPYGEQMASSLAGDLARRGITIVSGLARGIDIAAHRGALRAGGRTIAVLGSGIDVMYPPEHEADARAIARRGAVLSQFPAGAPPLPGHFPARNRVIAGLSLAVVIVEAAERSGSLITAGMAGDLGREVMAVPGRATSRESRGAHRLIKDGAALVEGWEDVVAQLPERWRACLPVPAPSPDPGARAPVPTEAGLGEAERRRLVELVTDDALGMDELIEASGLAPARVAALLGALEIEGHVRKLPGSRFARGPGPPRRDAL